MGRIVHLLLALTLVFQPCLAFMQSECVQLASAETKHKCCCPMVCGKEQGVLECPFKAKGYVGCKCARSQNATPSTPLPSSNSLESVKALTYLLIPLSVPLNNGTRWTSYDRASSDLLAAN